MSAGDRGPIKTVLITGGAGSVGREVALRLAAAGHQVRAFDLPGCDWTPLAGRSGIERIAGDIRDRDALARAAAGVDALLHLAALLPPASERSRAATTAVNVGGTANAIAALERAAPRARLVLSSSVCVYGDTSAAQPPVGVSAPLRAVDLYAETKIDAERLVAASGRPFTLLRISGISIPAFLEPPAVWPFQADQRLEFVCRSDVVAALAACVAAEGTTGKAFNVAGGPTWRMRGHDYVAAFNRVLGLAPEDAQYSARPGYFDWYDTAAAQAALGYQQTPFPRFLALLEQAVEEAFGASL